VSGGGRQRCEDLAEEIVEHRSLGAGESVACLLSVSGARQGSCAEHQRSSPPLRSFLNGVCIFVGDIRSVQGDQCAGFVVPEAQRIGSKHADRVGELQRDEGKRYVAAARQHQPEMVRWLRAQPLLQQWPCLGGEQMGVVHDDQFWGLNDRRDLPTRAQRRSEQVEWVTAASRRRVQPPHRSWHCPHPVRQRACLARSGGRDEHRQGATRRLVEGNAEARARDEGAWRLRDLGRGVPNDLRARGPALTGTYLHHRLADQLGLRGWVSAHRTLLRCSGCVRSVNQHITSRKG
jgi:hypothetical protein